MPWGCETSMLGRHTLAIFIWWGTFKFGMFTNLMKNYLLLDDQGSRVHCYERRHRFALWPVKMSVRTSKNLQQALPKEISPHHDFIPLCFWSVRKFQVLWYYANHEINLAAIAAWFSCNTKSQEVEVDCANLGYNFAAYRHHKDN